MNAWPYPSQQAEIPCVVNHRRRFSLIVVQACFLVPGSESEMAAVRSFVPYTMAILPHGSWCVFAVNNGRFT
jgi:hypothetical protein